MTLKIQRRMTFLQAQLGNSGQLVTLNATPTQPLPPRRKFI
jgi:hypothetical protein